jgi:hypothetical protein
MFLQAFGKGLYPLSLSMQLSIQANWQSNNESLSLGFIYDLLDCSPDLLLIA